MKSNWNLRDCIEGIVAVIQGIFIFGLAGGIAYFWYESGMPFLLSFYVGIIFLVHGGTKLLYHGSYIMIHGYYKEHDIK